MSTIEVTTPSRVPNCESMPRVKSMRKNSTDQNCAPGNWLMASVKMMKARPVPAADCVRMRRPSKGKSVETEPFFQLKEEMSESFFKAMSPACQSLTVRQAVGGAEAYRLLTV